MEILPLNGKFSPNNATISGRGGAKTLNRINGLRRVNGKRRAPEAAKMVLYKHIGRTSHITRWLRTPSQVVNTGVGGTVAIGGFTSANVTSALDWSSISGEFQQYRVKQIRMIATPCFLVPTTGALLTLYLARFWGLPQSSITNMASDPGFEAYSVAIEFVYENNWLGFPDAHLYVNVGTTIPTEQLFGINFISNTTPIGPASTSIMSWVAEYEVEFTGTY